MDEWLDFSDMIEKTQELIDLGLYDDALAILDQYAQTFPDEWEVQFLYSRILSEQNRPAEAIPYLQKGLSLDPTNVDCLLGLFYDHSMMNEVKQGGTYLLSAEKYHPDNELVLSALIWYYTELNDLLKAISYFERIRKKGSGNPETYRNAGIAYDRAGLYDNAAECFTMALEIHPGYDEVRELLSDLFITTGKADKAVELYEQALVESPNNIRYLSRLVFCQSQYNQSEKAIATAEESIRLYPNSPIGYVDLAYVYLNTGELDNAMSAADKALAIAPLDAESFRVKAIVHSEKGNYGEAEHTFETALSYDRDNPEILRDYYHHFRQTGNFKKMEELVLKVIEMEEPSCIEDYWFLADYYREKKENLKALHYLRKAYKIRPGENDLIPLIADILIDRGHPRLALKFLRRYVERAGWDDEMNRFNDYPQLKDKQTRESLQFLRYFGGRSSDFRRSAFTRYLMQLLIFSTGLILIAAAFPIYLYFGKIGIAGLAGFSAALAGAAATMMMYKKRRQRNSDSGFER